MYMACFGCESEYRIWKSPFENAGVDMELVIQNDMENEVRMHQVREQIYSRIPKEKVLILFQMNSMDLIKKKGNRFYSCVFQFQF